MEENQGLSNELLIDKDKETLVIDYSSFVDPFLLETLQNPRLRLTILRMELDIQKFLHNPEQLHFEFQHFPTSYIRLAAHRVAQHYGLQTMVLDNPSDGGGTKIMVMKTADCKYPSVCLSDVPAKQSENSKSEQVKIAIKPRPCRTSSDDSDMGLKQSSVRSVEERKEEYNKARARIFSGPSSPTSEETMPQVPADCKGLCPSKDENGGGQNFINDSQTNLRARDVGTSSRIAAIFKDREKDRFDPDYNRSYDRYVKCFPSQRFLPPFNMPKFQAPFVQYDAVFPQMGQIPRAQTALNYDPSDPSAAMNHYCTTMGLNQASQDAMYMPWPSPTMMYAHSYDQLRHSVFQAPFCQQPLSFGYSQNL